MGTAAFARPPRAGHADRSGCEMTNLRCEKPTKPRTTVDGELDSATCTRRLIAALILQTLLVAAIGLLALDMRAHARVENLGGVNVRGYRGPVLGQKRGNETRLAVVGGDLAFGWGVAPTETLAPFLRQNVGLDLEKPGPEGRVVTAVTAGAMGLAPAEYAGWISYLTPLEPDVWCLVVDPFDHAPSDNPFLPDRRSVVFERFGYSPILPLVLEEKGSAARSDALRSVGAALARIDARLAGRTGAEPPSRSRTDYLRAIDAAIRAGINTAVAGIVVVIPSPVGEQPDYSWAAIDLASRFDHEQRVRIVDLGTDDRLRDPALRLDGFHVSSAGHAGAAQRVAPAILQLIHRTRS